MAVATVVEARVDCILVRTIVRVHLYTVFSNIANEYSMNIRFSVNIKAAIAVHNNDVATCELALVVLWYDFTSTVDCEFVSRHAV